MTFWLGLADALSSERYTGDAGSSEEASSQTRTLSSPEDDESFESIDESLSAPPEPWQQTELEACNFWAGSERFDFWFTNGNGFFKAHYRAMQQMRTELFPLHHAVEDALRDARCSMVSPQGTASNLLCEAGVVV